MIKFNLGKLFQYNSELSSCRLFGKIEVWCASGTWRRPSEWVFDYCHTLCNCHMFEIGWFGITVLGKDCGGKYGYE
jgi:hypothetical protein